MAKEKSRVVPTACSSGSQKLGQPVPLSNFVVEEKSGRPQPAQEKGPRRRSCSSALEKGRSVASRRGTSYCNGVSSRCHSASVWATSNPAAEAGEPRRQVEATAAAAPTNAPAMRRRLVIMLPPCRLGPEMPKFLAHG